MATNHIEFQVQKMDWSIVWYGQGSNNLEEKTIFYAI
jgi:hypothetical protein